MHAGDLLRKWREKKGLTQTDAAKLLGMAQGVLSSYESGEREPSVGRALEIAKRTRGAVPVESWAERRTGTDG